MGKGNPLNYGQCVDIIDVIKDQYPGYLILNSQCSNEAEGLKGGACIRWLSPSKTIMLDFWPRTGTWRIGGEWESQEGGNVFDEGMPLGVHMLSRFKYAISMVPERRQRPVQSQERTPLSYDPEAQWRNAEGLVRLPDPHDPEIPWPNLGSEQLETYQVMRDKYAGSYSRYVAAGFPCGDRVTFGDDW